MPLPRNPQAVIFDMDGTIFNTEFLYYRAFLAAGQEQDLPVEPSLPLRTVGLSWESTTNLLLQHFGDSRRVQSLLAAWLRQFDRLAESELSLKPGVMQLLDQLDRLEIPSAIATSSYHDDVDRHLAAHGLSKRFAAVVANEDCVSVKPAPDPFLLAADRLSVDPTACLALEDSFQGVASASGAGMMTIMIPDMVAPTDEHRALCLYVVPDLHEVVELIAETPRKSEGLRLPQPLAPLSGRVSPSTTIIPG
jgi:HAD superfamily hydrolase (TIGR01509 family)